MTYPLITIAITCYEASETISQAIVSAFNQTWPNFEVIVVDDASKDNSLEIIASLKIQYPELIVMEQLENRGVAANRNTLIDNARGEFIVFFDDDDISMPSRLDRQYERILTFEKHCSSKNVLCYADRLQKHSDNINHYEVSIGSLNDKKVTIKGSMVAQRILFGKNAKTITGSGATCSLMARKSALINVNGYDEAFRRSEDTDFNVRFALNEGYFIRVDEALVIQKMTLSREKKLDEEKFYTLKLLEKHKNFIEKQTNYAFCKNWVINKFDFLTNNKISFLRKSLLLFLRHPILVLHRIYWALPNVTFNLKLKKLHKNDN